MKEKVRGDRTSRSEVDGMLRMFQLMSIVGENWYLGRFYSRLSIDRVIQDLKRQLKN